MRLACKQLVATLKPHFAEAGENATWQEVILKVHPDVGFNASKVSDCLSLLLFCLGISCDFAGALVSSAIKQWNLFLAICKMYINKYFVVEACASLC